MIGGRVGEGKRANDVMGAMCPPCHSLSCFAVPAVFGNIKPRQDQRTGHRGPRATRVGRPCMCLFTRSDVFSAFPLSRWMTHSWACGVQGVQGVQGPILHVVGPNPIQSNPSPSPSHAQFILPNSSEPLFFCCCFLVGEERVHFLWEIDLP